MASNDWPTIAREAVALHNRMVDLTMSDKLLLPENSDDLESFARHVQANYAGLAAEYLRLVEDAKKAEVARLESLAKKVVALNVDSVSAFGVLDMVENLIDEEIAALKAQEPE